VNAKVVDREERRMVSRISGRPVVMRSSASRAFVALAATLGFALSLVASLVGTTVAAAATWHSSGNISLPTNAAGSSKAAYLEGVACLASGECVAVGNYASNEHVMGVIETGGVWGQASEIALPVDSMHPNAGPFVACSMSGRCVAVGDYETTSGNFQGWATSVAGGVWGQASEIALPANAATQQFAQFVILSDVACLASGPCVAVGSYNDTSGTRQAMIVSETGGVWDRAIEIAPPPNATNPDAELNQVACPAYGSCVAVGRYEESVGSGQAMVTSETGGVWSQASQVGLPVNAAGNPDPHLWGVACPRSGPCVAVGGYNDNSATAPQAMAVNEAGGMWSRASEITLPANTASPDDELTRVACPASGSCVAGGFYEGECCDHIHAMVVNEVDGEWGQASEITPPNLGNPDLEFACRAAGACVAAGNNDSHALGISEKGGVWGEATEIMPSNAGPPDGLAQVACVVAGPCIAVGDEYSPTLGFLPWVVTETPGGGEAPTSVTTEASAVAATSATLNAVVNPNGEAVSGCYFEYGTTESYGASAPCTSLPGSGEGPVAVSAAVGALSESTTYHFRIVAVNASGTSYGSDQAFKARPTVETQAATSVTATSATVNATVNPNDEAISGCYFEYGTTESYGTSVPCTPFPGSGESPLAVSASIAGLTTSTSYHFRIVAVNPGGTSYGADETLTTVFSAEFGRCVKVAPEKVGKSTVYRGGFTKATCLEASTTHTGKYEWESGVVGAGFTTAGAAAKLETINKTKVTCTSESGRGNIAASTAVEDVVFRFAGCESAAHKCTTTGLAEGELESNKLEGTLGFESKASNEVGLDLYPSGGSGPFMQFNCNGFSTVLTGSLIGSVTADKIATTAALKFKASKGIQTPEAFEAGPKDILLSSLNGAAPEQAGLTLATTQTYEEAVEINAAV
jgi:hypothetical protein